MSRGEERRNVALLVLDTVRKDVFDEYAWRLTTRADVSSPGCRAASSWSVPSHASMLTGTLAHEHGIHAYNRDYTALNWTDTLLGDLADRHRFGVSANVYAGSDHGFDAGFDTFVDATPRRRYPDALDPVAAIHNAEDAPGPLPDRFGVLRAVASHDRPLRSLANLVALRLHDISIDFGLTSPFDDGATVTRRALSRVVDSAPEPWFCFVNLMDAHSPHRLVRGYDRSKYSGPNDFQYDGTNAEHFLRDPDDHHEEIRWTRELYAASVEYLDRVVDGLLDDLAAGTNRETTIVITADHGENLGYDAEEGRFGHTGSLSEALLHVPLLVVNPPEGLAFERRFVSHLGLRELLTGLAHGETPDVSTDRAVAEVVGPAPGNDGLVGLDPGGWELLRRCTYEGTTKVEWDSTGAVRSYALDPERPCWQPEPEPGTVPGWAEARFGGDAAAYEREARERATEAETSAETRQRLQDLGYL